MFGSLLGSRAAFDLKVLLDASNLVASAGVNVRECPNRVAVPYCGRWRGVI